MKLRGLVALAFLALSGCSAVAPTVVVGEAGCIGISAQICTQVLAAVEAGGKSDATGFRVRCTTRVCDDQSGELVADIVWFDGTRTSRALTWVHGFDASVLLFAVLPIPTPPVPSTCVGVPDNECESEWSTAMENISPDRFSSIAFVRVECSAACSATSGAGQTIIGFRDGTTIRPSTWSYHHTP